MRSRFFYTVAILALTVAMQSGATHAQSWKKERQPMQHELNYEPFTTIENGLPAEVHVTVGSQFKVVGETKYIGLIDDLSITCKNSVLKLEASPKVLERLSALKVFPVVKFYVTMPSVEALRVKGVGDIQVQTDLHCDTLDLQVHGSGSISFKDVEAARGTAAFVNGSGDISGGNVTAASAAFELAGSGDVKCKELLIKKALSISLMGSGDIVMKDVQAKKADVLLKGSGNVQTNQLSAGERLTVISKGSGDISLGAVRGKITDIQMLSSGSIELLELFGDSISLSNKSSGDIKTGRAGEAKKCSIMLAGSGDIDASQLVVNEVKAEVSGSGDVYVNATQTLWVGSGMRSSTVFYRGQPQITIEPNSRVELNHLD